MTQNLSSPSRASGEAMTQLTHCNLPSLYATSAGSRILFFLRFVIPIAHSWCLRPFSRRG